jgi:membrane dipeptidase
MYKSIEGRIRKIRLPKLSENISLEHKMIKKTFILLLISFTIFAADNSLKQKAVVLSQKYIIVDTHVDLPLHLRKTWIDVTKERTKGQMDYPRAVKGGLNAPFMSIYVPPRLQGTPEAKAYADTLIVKVEKLERLYPDKFKIARTVNDVLKNFDEGVISLPMGMENGAPIQNDELLQYYYDKGIRYVTLAHGKWNHICDSSYDPDKHWGGLSQFGKELIGKMNRIGIMVDVSHVSDDAFYQIIELTETPVIASHSSCRYFTPGFERNMSDDMIKKLAEIGGVIQINFGSDFLDEDYRERKRKYRANVKAFMDEHQLERNDPKVKEHIENYLNEHPVGYSTLEKVADHIDHAVKLVGINHVGLGSDFDGVGDSLPIGLKDVSMYPNLIEELLKRGYSEEDIQKICSGNILRVWKQVEDYAAAN